MGEYAPEPFHGEAFLTAGEAERRIRAAGEAVKRADAASKAMMAALAQAGGQYLEFGKQMSRIYGSNGTVHIAGGGGGAVSAGGGGGGGVSYGGNGGSAGAAGGGGGGLGGQGSTNMTYGGGGISFTPRERRPREPEPRTALGTVTGYRWWTLSAPDLLGFPSDAEQAWPHGLLHGAQDDWAPGVNIAYCSSCTDAQTRLDMPYAPHDPGDVPARHCHCGFWAYWKAQEHSMATDGVVPIFGVIRGWGRFRRGPYGFRVQRAKILALHTKFVLQPYADAPGVRPGADFRGLLSPGWHEVELRPRGEGLRARKLPDGREVLLPASVTDAQIRVAFENAEAWAAVIGDRLAQTYNVPVFETRDLLLSKFPPDKTYA